MNHVPPPTPEVIRRRCLEVQATWDEATRRQRAGLPQDFPAVCEITMDPKLVDKISDPWSNTHD